MEKGIYTTIRNFDFDKVHDIMVSLNWKWFDGKNFSIPSTKKLKETVKNKLKEISYDLDKCDNVSSLCGGFLFIGKKRDNKKYYELYFVIAYSDNY